MPKVKEVKKPSNAFFIYRKSVISRIKAEFQVDHSSKISKIAAQLWKDEAVEVKLMYKNQANAEREKFLVENPNFVWPSKKITAHKRVSSTSSTVSVSSENSLGVELVHPADEYLFRLRFGSDKVSDELFLPKWDFNSADEILKDFFNF